MVALAMITPHCDSVPRDASDTTSRATSGMFPGISKDTVFPTVGRALTVPVGAATTMLVSTRLAHQDPRATLPPEPWGFCPAIQANAPALVPLTSRRRCP